MFRPLRWHGCETMSAERVVSLDSSAIVKLVVREAETAALRRFLRRRRTLVSSALARTEVLRSVMAHGEPAQKTAESVLARVELPRINDRVLRAAGMLPPAGLRTLNAIHLASALTLSDNLTHVVCYDDRLARAAIECGLTTAAPDQSWHSDSSVTGGPVRAETGEDNGHSA